MSWSTVSIDTQSFLLHPTPNTDLNSSTDPNSNQSSIKDQKGDQANASNSSTSSSKSPSTSTSSTSTSSTSTSSSHTEASRSSPTEKGSKKTRIPANPRTPPKLTSLSPKSSSFRIPAQAAPKSPRQLKEQKEIPSSATSSSASSEITSFSQPEMPVSSLRLISRIVRKEIPLEIIKNLNKECIQHKVINFLIDDICAGSFSLDNRQSIGRIDSAFYKEKLPDELQTYTKGLNQSTISSSRLLSNIFSEEFTVNEGWLSAKNLYVNFIFREKSREGISIGENDADIKDAERDRLKIFADLITKTIFGSPVKIKNSPLPKALVKSLIYADQRFHEKLLNHKSTQNWTIEQIRDARVSLLKLFCVTRLLMPMLTALAD